VTRLIAENPNTELAKVNLDLEVKRRMAEDIMWSSTAV
jgi:hypothetical protein